MHAIYYIPDETEFRDQQKNKTINEYFHQPIAIVPANKEGK